MSRIPGLFRFLPIALVVILAAPSLTGAGKWKMAKEVKPIYYKVQSTSFNRRGKKTVVVDVDIEASEEKDDRGEPMWRVKTSQEQLMRGRELGGGMAFGAAAAGWAGVAGMHWMMYQQLLNQLELAVGEKMSYFGGMLAKVTGTEKIAGHEGFVVEMFNTQKDEPVLIAALVIHPDIPIALRARSYNQGKLQHENLLLEVNLKQ